LKRPGPIALRTSSSDGRYRMSALLAFTTIAIGDSDAVRETT
jgi:hypothetical protein